MYISEREGMRTILGKRQVRRTTTKSSERPGTKWGKGKERQSCGIKPVQEQIL